MTSVGNASVIALARLALGLNRTLQPNPALLRVCTRNGGKDVAFCHR
jgi:hypothetical protein